MYICIYIAWHRDKDCDLLHDRSVISIGRMPHEKQNGNCLDYNQTLGTRLQDWLNDRPSAVTLTLISVSILTTSLHGVTVQRRHTSWIPQKWPQCIRCCKSVSWFDVCCTFTDKKLALARVMQWQYTHPRWQFAMETLIWNLSVAYVSTAIRFVTVLFQCKTSCILLRILSQNFLCPRC
jgi:hypothetical protein